jgi:hypothetical protein
MAINYDEVIAELRAVEVQLQKELKQVQDAIPAMIVLRNKSKGAAKTQPIPKGDAKSSPIKKPFSRTGPTEAIPVFLRQIDPGVASSTREVLDGLTAGGWTTKGEKPLNIVRATLSALAEKGIVEKVGEGWRLKPFSTISPDAFLTTGQQQPSPQ